MARKHEHSLDDPARVEENTTGERAATCCSVVGIGGSLVCSLSMVAAAIGLFASAGATAGEGAASSMPGMSGMGSSSGSTSRFPGWLDALVRLGPEILIGSALLVTIAVWLRRKAAVVPAVIGGVILYVGMYVQPNLAIMYGAIVLGTILLALAYVASLRPTLRSGVPSLDR